MPKITKLEDALNWPEEELQTVTIQCSGKGFLEYQALVAAGDDCESFLDVEENDASEDDELDPVIEDSAPAVDLFSLSEEGLEEVDYYKVLHLSHNPNLTPDDVKKAYRKACLKYHPDKSGRGEEDAVFLKVKSAFETLSTRKQAYDSTEMPFDDSLPDEKPDDFYQEYGLCFDLNLHFDARLLQNSNNSSSKKNRRKSRNSHITKPPFLGTESTPVDKVHEFYDYWTHFETWRDFGLLAARELETTDHVENAESRYEKRWYQKQIDNRAKKLKQQEQARITTLVERAMAADPRLIQERKRLIQEKEDRQRQKEQDALDKIKEAEEAKLAEEQRLVEEKQKKQGEKMQREKEKKLFRKVKQVFRKLVGEALASLLEPAHILDDEVDLICAELNREQLIKFNTNLESKSAPGEVLELVKKRSQNLLEKKDEGDEACEANGAQNGSSNGTHKQAPPPPSKSKIPFSKEEMVSLAKAVKKFPPGGANRWDQIANYINNVIRPQDLRTKEECIETFNQNKAAKPPTQNGFTSTSKPAESATTAESDPNGWSEEQDKLLQAGLSKFPSTMDKNERWGSIAKCVPGKSKKECVERFKSIRDVIKSRK